MCSTNGGYHIELSEEHLRELLRRAEAAGITPEEYMNRLIRKFLEEPPPEGQIVA